MQPQKAIEIDAVAVIIWNRIGQKPVFIKPDVKQQHCKKTCEIEDIFFERHTSTQCRSLNIQGGQRIWENEKVVCEKEIQRRSKRKEESNRPPECFSRDLNSLLRNKPECDNGNGENEKQQAYC